MKPILFNTEMVCAIRNGNKTATRRLVKGACPDWDFAGIEERPYERRVKADGTEYPKALDWAHAVFSAGNGYCDYPMIKVPYKHGSVLYVRETFKIDYLSNIPGFGRIHYKADDTYGDFTFSPERYETMRRAQLKPGWRPNENMPREAARIFLLVMDVKVQRVQDITEEEARKEGCESRENFIRVWNDCYAKPQPVKVKGVIDHYESYPWEDIQETRTYRGKPWYVIGNPWVRAIGFEKCEKEGVLA